MSDADSVVVVATSILPFLLVVLLLVAIALPCGWLSMPATLPKQKFKLGYALGGLLKDDVAISTATFDPQSGSAEVLWHQFEAQGALSDTPAAPSPAGCAGAVCQQVTVPPSSTTELTFVLTWDSPLAHFGSDRVVERR